MTPRAVLRASLFGLALSGSIGAQLYPVPVIPTPDLFDSTSGDLDGDGTLDLVVTPTLSFTLRVFLSDGALGFVQLPDVPTPVRDLLTVGDITGDGAVDVLAQTSAGELLYVFPGDGNGGLGAPLTFPMGNRLSSAHVIDLDEDGHADVFGNRNTFPTALVTLFGDGAGQLSAPASFPLPSAALMDIADLDADGHVDVVTARTVSGQANLQVVMGDGPGGFAAPVLYPIGASSINLLRLGDWNSDGHQDAAAIHNASTGDDLLIRLWGDGSGAFGAPVATPLSTDESWMAMDRHDVEGDGDLDLLVNAVSARAYYLLRNDGSGNFAAPTYALPSADALALGHLDGDGFTDAAIVLRTYGLASGGLAIVPGLATGGFAAPLWYDASEHNAAGLAVADLNGDGHLDALCGASTHSSEYFVSVILGDGTGAFGPPTFLPQPTKARYLAVGDLDEDGAPDIVTSNAESDAVMVLLADGVGGFGAPIPYVVGDHPEDLALADLDADGHLELVVASGTSAAPTVRVLRGDGSGWLAAPLVTPVGSLVTQLDVADVDHDLLLDGAGTSSPGVVLLRGDGGGGFASVATLPTGDEGPQGISISDVDLDGDRDIVTGNLAGTVCVLEGDGFGGFGAAAIVPVGNAAAAMSIAVGDVSGDGWPDLVVPRDDQDRVFVLLGDGTGAFGLESAGYVIGYAPSPIALADVTEDHRPDVVCGLHRAIGVMPSIGQPFPWKSLGHALAGSAGEPGLAGHGTLATGSTVSLALVNAKPLSIAYLIASHTNLSAPFKGGVLVPFPSIVVVIGTNASGGFALSATVGPGIPSGFTHYFQTWVSDPGGPVGFTASNALSGTTP